MVIVSGDGLMFEAVQALTGREDADDLRPSLPLGIVAGGSGNGLARSLAHEAGRAYSANGVAAASACVARGNARPMDIIRLKMAGGWTVHAFLSFGVGYLSDVDIDSERARWMGELRFTLWSLLLLRKLRTYHATIEYLSGKPLCSSTSCPGMSCDRCWATTTDDFIMIYAVSSAYISSTAMMAPRARTDDGLIWLMLIRAGVSRKRMLRFLLGLGEGTFVGMGEVELVPVRAVRYSTWSCSNVLDAYLGQNFAILFPIQIQPFWSRGG